MTRQKLIKYILGTFVLLYLSVDIYIYFKYNDKSTAQALTWTTTMYSTIPADSIPQNIIKAYNKVYTNSLTNNIYPDLIWFLYSRGQHQSFVQLDLAYDIGHKSGFKLISIANQIDNKLTQEQCIYAYLSRFDFLNNALGIKQAAKIYYNKSIQDLNETECLELVIMTKNPALFNKLRHQDTLDKEVQKLLGLTASHGAMRAERRIAKPIYCPVDTGTFFHLALLINISTFNKRFGGQTDEVS